MRVLVVDDEEALADLLSSYLDRDGFEVSMAHDGRQAIDQAREVDPDVMVLTWAAWGLAATPRTDAQLG
mgnify:FL=1